MELELSELKNRGEAPSWMTPAGYQTVAGGYLEDNETPKGMYQRLARSVSKYIARPDLEAKFFDIMWKGWLCPATPVLTNTGGTRGYPISCFGTYVPDTIHGIYDAVTEGSCLSARGGGISHYLGAVRGSGAKIKSNGKSNGLVPWCKQFDTATWAVSQGNLRRGARAVYVDVDHADMEDVMRIRNAANVESKQCLNLNVGVNVTDAFMASVVAGDPHAREKWANILKERIEFNEPYIIFIDRMNNDSPQLYKDQGLKVHHSNLCFTPNTEVLMGDGSFKTLSALAKQYKVDEQKVEIITSEFIDNQWREVKKYAKPFYSGRKAVVQVDMADNCSFRSTPDHEIFTYSQTECKTSQAKDLAGHFVFGRTGSQKYFPLEALDVVAKGWEDVYDLTVDEQTPRFFIKVGEHNGEAITALVHNCTEIALASDEDHSFVCDLSSANLTKWFEWKDDPEFIELCIRFLDGVMEEFIQRAQHERGFERAVRFARKSRALGLGVLGWHSLLQSMSIPFGSFKAEMLNNQIFPHIHAQAEAATKLLAVEYGEPEWCKGYGRRNSHTMAIAPTASISVIVGQVSPGIEPISKNVFSHNTMKGTFIVKNQELIKVLEKYGQNTDETWLFINSQKGSVQNLHFLSDNEREVFKTATEIDQMSIIRQAGNRQKFIDQAQSINLFFDSPPNKESHLAEYKAWTKAVNNIHIEAWKQGLKSLYYMRTSPVIKPDTASREHHRQTMVEEPAVEKAEPEDCHFCQ